MPRYLVERTFVAGHTLPDREQDHQTRLIFDGNNTAEGVTWLHSYVSGDRRRTFCLYEAPDPAALRRAASRNELPIDRITEVSVLDP
ncbi:hypothetical protein TFLX_00692 [Thermoflexales bacterium]|nr:hypothetical protein TFLX_00692 [Thermoflexales bacterium]